ncbi:MAG TPA: HNH endonuclease signature motif containing protein [bacterium]|nr:HNH endonuclease signature motif containing protein [bacterium]
MPKIDPRLQAILDKVTAKRARVVIDHILKNGFITTDDLTDYGYDHPPRAARDVREHGIPLVTYRTKGRNGRSIAAYKFGNPDDIQEHKLGGRQVLSKELHRTLFEKSSGRCYSCWHVYEDRYLTIDHRIPYEIAGEIADQNNVDAFMLLCGTCQRKKSWSCEHCQNWSNKIEKVCQSCIWASPESYSHIAMDNVRQIEVTFQGAEAEEFDKRITALKKAGIDPHDVIRESFFEKKITKKK